MSSLAEELDALEQQARNGNGASAGDNTLNLDLSNVEVMSGFELMPEGYYPGRIVKVEKKSPPEKTPYLNLEFVVTAGPFKKRKLWDTVMLAGKGLSRFVILASAVDMYNSTTKRFTGLVSDFNDKELWLNVVIEEERIDDGIKNPANKGKKYPARNKVHPWEGFHNINKYALPEDSSSETIPDFDAVAAEAELGNAEPFAVPEETTGSVQQVEVEEATPEANVEAVHPETAEEAVAEEATAIATPEEVQETVAEAVKQPVVAATPVQVQKAPAPPKPPVAPTTKAAQSPDPAGDAPPPWGDEA